MDKLQKP